MIMRVSIAINESEKSIIVLRFGGERRQFLADQFRDLVYLTISNKKPPLPGAFIPTSAGD